MLPREAPEPGGGTGAPPRLGLELGAQQCLVGRPTGEAPRAHLASSKPA